ncbi:MAG TPA: hypothetical protein VIY72_13700 [Acidimicrobiales bacterium]
MYRVVQWGTGNVGKEAIRTILGRPDFELVGVRVYSPDKVGKDAGEIIGEELTGVIATDDTEAIVALDADVVCHTPLGGVDAQQATADICALLASGKNVVSSALEEHAFMRPGTTEGRAPLAFEQISEACEKGGSTFFHGGVNPGYSMDLYPILLSRLSRRIDKITTTEVVDMTRYTSEHMVRAIGFGIAPDEPAPLDQSFEDIYHSPFYLSMRMLAEGIGIELDDVRYHRERAVADHPVTMAAGTLEAGTVAVMRFHVEGYVGDRLVLDFQYVWRMSDDVAPDWPRGDSRWLVRIDGDPLIESEIDLTTTVGTGRAVSLTVATLNLNAIPTVVAAPPGVLDNTTIAMFGGGYLTA